MFPVSLLPMSPVHTYIHDGGEKPVPAHDTEGRNRLAEYLLRHPFSLQKITWNPTTQTVIYRSKRHHTTTPPHHHTTTPPHHQAQLRNLQSPRFHRRRH